VLEKIKTLYIRYTKLAQLFPRTSRHTLGTKLDMTLIEILELLSTASYQSLETKKVTLAKALAKIDTFKFLLMVAWEAGFIRNRDYSELSEGVHEIGRITGGWKKGLENKTPHLF
jgi:hypothetical protein